MRKQTIGKDDSADAETTIERAFEFVRDVLDDPTVLDELPERATLTITPIENRDSQTRYSATTRRFAISAVETDPKKVYEKGVRYSWGWTAKPMHPT